MIVPQEQPFTEGYTPVTSLHGPHAEMMLDFGILKLAPGDRWVSDKPLERAFLLISGDIEFSWEENSHHAVRYSCFDENPTVLHVPSGVLVNITAAAESEICIERTENEKLFPSRLFTPEDIRCDVFGAGTLNDASIRTVRTIFDGEIAPESNMVIGEVINHPGKWSSYPPHDHPQPEIYHYRFFPRQGFGVSLLDEQAQVVKHGYSSLIPPDTTHSQVAAPGYAMYYIWMIPHLPDDRWLPTTRYYREDHQWLLAPDVTIWPERSYGEEQE
ncbi:MAG: 5-deoxy-glucuronate isomerase [Spirochaetia bacterium]|nr:5-deoxy-glucuronate isomerase [Spirochaetia bacterium]MCF7942684.1 5-deoxy-glucuronate isomerase [Spirochaetia bacterium]